LGHALPLISGRRVLEVSFGTGYLLGEYAGRFEVYGVDLNRRMARLAQDNLRKKGLAVEIQIARVEALPYESGTFDTLVNTMAFTGYPNADQAMREMRRVLKPGGRLVMIDINYPADGNRLGVFLARFWEASGDLIRDMRPLFQEYGFEYQETEVGGWGSVHLYVASKS
jgi:ubiquinone/menaquinone biosynthesis C-methylase UbiE